MLKKSFYADFLKLDASDKDSIFEMCTILEYDQTTMLAKVIGNTSKQIRSNVPVLFPSLFLNAGIVSPPAKFSTGIIFWGSERNCYLFPAQFLPPTSNQVDGEISYNSSPGQIQSFFSFSNVDGGEHCVRSLAGNYIHVKNNDSIVLASSDLQKVQLSSKGLYILADNEEKQIDHSHSYLGTVGENDIHFKWTIDHKNNLSSCSLTPEDVPFDGDDTSFTDVEVTNIPAISIQLGSVYKQTGSEQIKQNSIIDGSKNVVEIEVFDSESSDKSMHFSVSAKGAIHSFLENEEYETEMIIRPGGIKYIFKNKNTNAVIEQTFGFGW